MFATYIQHILKRVFSSFVFYSKMRFITLISLTIGSAAALDTLLPLRRRQTSNPSPILSTRNGVVFETQVQVNNQTFYLVPDTGSSDLWVPTSKFQCIDPSNNQPIPQADCHFGTTYSVPNSTEYVANQTFGAQYGTGIALGPVAYADVTLNGIRVERQKIGLVDRTNEIGNGIGAGTLGLSFPPLTSAHPGNTLDNTTLLVNRAVYDPVFVTMFKRGLVEPWYSFAIERPIKNSSTSPGGWLGLGQLPPVAHADSWAVKPIEVTENLPEELTGGVRQITLMTLTVDGVVWSGPGNGTRITNLTTFQAVVDTGNHMNLLPSSIATAINGAFDPPGVFDAESHVYVVDCNATTPELGIVLDRQTFWHQQPEDFIYSDGNGGCFSSIAPTAEDEGIVLNFLGDAFLRNVVSVYDFGKSEMRFAARTDGNSSVGGGVSVVYNGMASSTCGTAWFLLAAALAIACWI